jgi:hypothetical protein
MRPLVSAMWCDDELIIPKVLKGNSKYVLKCERWPRGFTGDRVVDSKDAFITCDNRDDTNRYSMQD